MTVPPLASKAIHVADIQNIDEDITEPIDLSVSLDKPKIVRKYTRSTSTTLAKRVKEIASGPGKRHKTIFSPIEWIRTQEEESPPSKKMRGEVPIQSQGEEEVGRSKKKQWKTIIEKVNPWIINEGDFTKLNKYYHVYNKFEKTKS